MSDLTDLAQIQSAPEQFDTIRDRHIPKSSPADVAAGVLDGFANGQEEIFPGPMPASIAPAGTRLERRSSPWPAPRKPSRSSLRCLLAPLPLAGVAAKVRMSRWHRVINEQ